MPKFTLKYVLMTIAAIIVGLLVSIYIIGLPLQQAINEAGIAAIAFLGGPFASNYVLARDKKNQESEQGKGESNFFRR
ncbi:hypothetical protein [Dictyobacter kobayashii]|uniref:Uncharacterized protein n=1 Tax=Dictyobacter kobayashii TaxID=2014872 RepID=A0A402AJ59_9CHLR|nr:hypothetical protein [Dictyobacter kobayashii]GCE19103.1 hypothetical protein KDK_29030 [Dictyobacter kobayashii]